MRSSYAGDDVSALLTADEKRDHRFVSARSCARPSLVSE